MEEKTEKPKTKINFKKIFKNTYIQIGVVVAVILIFVFALVSFLPMQTQQVNTTQVEYDTFRDCLYLNFNLGNPLTIAILPTNEICQRTKTLLKKYGEYIIYVDCSKEKMWCKEKGVVTVPTFFYKDKVSQGLMSIEGLKEFMGCK